ncbi:CPBP family intramembrane glutamic endopeptidase [Halomicroarcula sp. GCM10025709]|uniref:CPBP family intramembrane glutamic endopeptidase n=1 Tax=Haloarcula TaxID=2237 RepID=UPI0024C2352D|nr:CPBP family intramembrane metalloprotease [Halomicroarcula sp. YJ-61-S]
MDQFAVGVIMLLAAGTVLAVATRLDHRPLSAYGIARSRRWATDLGVGLAGGVLMSGVPIAVGVALGYGAVTTVFAGVAGGSTGLAVVAIVFGQVSNVLYEEVLFRSVMIQNFADGLSARLDARQLELAGAIGMSSVVFGFSHVIFAGGGGTEGRSIQLIFSATLFGLAWATAYVLTGHIAFPVGIHLAYNLSNGFLFQVSSQLSAGTSFPALLRIGVTSGGFWNSTLLTALRFGVALSFTVGWVYFRDGNLRVAIERRTLDSIGSER